jgi:hypothetical protein
VLHAFLLKRPILPHLMFAACMAHAVFFAECFFGPVNKAIAGMNGRSF